MRLQNPMLIIISKHTFVVLPSVDGFAAEKLEGIPEMSSQDGNCSAAR